MAKQLYDYWFVQFDFPDENGRPYKSSGGKMVWNDTLKREIPVCWHCGNLLEIAVFTLLMGLFLSFNGISELSGASSWINQTFFGTWYYSF